MALSTSIKKYQSQIHIPYSITIPNLFRTDAYATSAIILTVIFGLFVVFSFAASIIAFKFIALFLFLVPAAAFICSVISIKKHAVERSAVLSYISLAITTLYFSMILALPILLLGLYLIYSYVLT